MSSVIFTGSAGTPPAKTTWRRAGPASPSETRQAASLHLLLFLGRNRQSEDRDLTCPGDVDPPRIFRTGQVERLAEFAAIDFGVRSPCFLHAAALLFDHVGGVEPALQMSATELALFVFFVAGTLARLLDLDFVVRKLRNRRRDRSCRFAGSHSFSWRALVKAACPYFTQLWPLDQDEPLW